MGIELARRIEAAEGALAAACAHPAAHPRAGVLRLAGGVAAYAGPDIPASKIVGLGLEGPVEPSELDLLEPLVLAATRQLLGIEPIASGR